MRIDIRLGETAGDVRVQIDAAPADIRPWLHRRRGRAQSHILILAFGC